MANREDLIKKKTDLKMTEIQERLGLQRLHSNYDNFYEKCRSDAEYEVDIGAYKG